MAHPGSRAAGPSCFILTAPLGRWLCAPFFSWGAGRRVAWLLAVVGISTPVCPTPGPAATALLGAAWPAGHQQPLSDTEASPHLAFS